MSEQLSILDKQVLKAKREKANAKRRWENGFQKWSDNQGMDNTEDYGACGYGSMCDYCEDNSYGRPCVRALNAMLRDTGGHIDYKNETYEEAWEGQKHE